MQGLDLTIYQITLTITRRHPGLVKNKWGPTADKAKRQNRNKNKSHIHSDQQSSFGCMAYVDFQINLRQRAFAFAKKNECRVWSPESLVALETAPCVRFFYVRAQWEGFGPAGSTRPVDQPVVARAPAWSRPREKL
jgi:hypothetical protein